MSQVEFDYFDCDNHYYEALDAFTRYLDPAFKKRAMQWVEVDGKRRLMVGERINRFIPNPTFDPIAKPGSLDEYFRGRNPRGQDTPDLFGELDRMADHPEYRDSAARLAFMDGQGMGACIMLPTLGVGMEQALLPDLPAVLAAFEAFNRWILDDWGFARDERIFAAPVLTLVDPAAAERTVDWAVENDARFVLIVPGPVMTASGMRSPFDPVFDGVWSRIDAAGLTVVVHGGDSWYSQYGKDWGEKAGTEAFRQNPFRALMSANPTQDFFANLLAHGVLHRWSNLRFAAVETGSDWVFHLDEKLKKSWGQTPHAYAEDPRETFKRHVWVSPFYEDELGRLKDLLGVERILMGSDYPHAEGLADPSSYIKDLRNFGYTDDEAFAVMRTNGYALAQRRTS
jgi:predicted TIM-barrel fold metal-dependent hydrolase